MYFIAYIEVAVVYLLFSSLYLFLSSHHAAILANPDFQGRVVVDVGAGGGILSLFASQVMADYLMGNKFLNVWSFSFFS